jgi:hypothetical protein
VYSVRIFVEIRAIVTEIFLDFPQPLKVDAGIVPRLDYVLFISKLHSTDTTNVTK